MSWENLDRGREGSAHYSVLRLRGNGMEALRGMFPDANADDMNAVLFSTSGIHGTYNTIEEAEARVLRGDMEHNPDVTFLIVQPRMVTLRYGNCRPQTADDFAFLKRLRATSLSAIASIGAAPASVEGDVR